MALDKDFDSLKREFAANLQSFGQNGFKIVSSTLVTGEFIAITALEESVLTASIPSGMNADAPSGLVIPAGLTIYGKFNDVVCSSGKVIAYNVTKN